MKLCAIQTNPKRADVFHNIEAIKRQLDLAKDCDLVVLPELASTGYLFTEKEELLPMAETCNGLYCSVLRQWSVGNNCTVISGFAEIDNKNLLYNSAIIAMPNGDCRVYRKSHLFYKEKLIFQQGDTGFFVVECMSKSGEQNEKVKVGTMICYDWRFPEAARTLALAGADIIAHPSNLVAPKSMWSGVMATRSFENKVFTITANRCGREQHNGEELAFSGESQITNTSGAIIAIAPKDSEYAVFAEIDISKSRNKSFNEFNNIFSDRRTELYKL